MWEGWRGFLRTLLGTRCCKRPACQLVSSRGDCSPCRRSWGSPLYSIQGRQSSLICFYVSVGRDNFFVTILECVRGTRDLNCLETEKFCRTPAFRQHCWQVRKFTYVRQGIHRRYGTVQCVTLLVMKGLNLMQRMPVHLISVFRCIGTLASFVHVLYMCFFLLSDPDLRKLFFSVGDPDSIAIRILIWI